VFGWVEFIAGTHISSTVVGVAGREIEGHCRCGGRYDQW
jgi:hypothetical protein